MKAILIVLFLMILGGTLHANSVDDLRTDQDVVKFLKSIHKEFGANKNYSLEILPTDSIAAKLDCDSIFKKWDIKNWEKADFNKDGHADLIVLVDWDDFGVYVAMDKGDNTFTLLRPSNEPFNKCQLGKPVKNGDQQFLLFYRRMDEYAREDRSPLYLRTVEKMDTLIYKFGDFVELNRTPENEEIDSIQFRTGRCFGECPVFSISLARNGGASYHAMEFNPEKGKFRTRIKKANLDEIIQLADYLSLKKLKDRYDATWTDDQTSWLRVRFKDGTMKEIRDYGLKGTFGLTRLYRLIFDLRENQTWEK